MKTVCVFLDWPLKTANQLIFIISSWCYSQKIINLKNVSFPKSSTLITGSSRCAVIHIHIKTVQVGTSFKMLLLVDTFYFEGFVICAKCPSAISITSQERVRNFFWLQRLLIFLWKGHKVWGVLKNRCLCFMNTLGIFLISPLIPLLSKKGEGGQHIFKRASLSMRVHRSIWWLKLYTC